MGAGDGAIFTRQSTTVDGMTVRYLKGGVKRDYAPALFLHGMGGGGKWETFHMALATDTLALAPVLPGWQEGELPDSIASAKDFAKIVLKFMDAVQLDKVTLIGHSIGGWVALYLALEHPERVSRLALIDSLGLELPNTPIAKLEEMDQDAFAKAVFAKLGQIAPNAYGFGSELQNVRTSPDFEQLWKGRDMVVKLAKCRYSDPELLKSIKRIEASTLVIWGKLDGIVPVQHGEALKSAIKNSQLAIIAKAGHVPTTERPQTISYLVRNFIVGQKAEQLPDTVRSELVAS